jgi:hypothetical protein
VCVSYLCLLWRMYENVDLDYLAAISVQMNIINLGRRDYVIYGFFYFCLLNSTIYDYEILCQHRHSTIIMLIKNQFFWYNENKQTVMGVHTVRKTSLVSSTCLRQEPSIFFPTGLSPLSITWMKITKSENTKRKFLGRGQKASWAVSGNPLYALTVETHTMGRKPDTTLLSETRAKYYL